MNRSGGQARDLFSAILKNESGNLMLAHLIDQMRARRLPQISDPASETRERRSLQLRQIEAERNLPLKPWLHGVPVGRYHVYRRGAGQSAHVQVGELAVYPLPAYAFAPGVEIHPDRQNQH